MSIDPVEVGLVISMLSISIAVLKQNGGSKNGRYLTSIDAEKRFTDQKLCGEIHRNVKEKLDCIPIIKTTLTKIATKMKIKEEDESGA